MKFVARNYKKHKLLFCILFLNILLYTIIMSLVLFKTLVLVKFIIIRFIFLFLYKFKIIQYLFSFIITIYYWMEMRLTSSLPDNSVSSETLDKVEEDRVKHRDKTSLKVKEEEELSNVTAIGLAIFVFGLGLGVPALKYFYPDAIPAITNAAIAVGAALLSGIEKISVTISDDFSDRLEKLKVHEVEEASDSINEQAVLVADTDLALTRAKIAGKVINIMRLNDSTIHILLHNNVPSNCFGQSSHLRLVLNGINQNSPGSGPFFEQPLTKTDVLFYEIILAMDVK